ncbi:TetR/AcrR family transcriptional regulator [Streptomyces amakusaensis]|uniref:TetR/AcrR family transcriptional regulator n=1 Tax=Streptomyces amakusaensis TaxID=67271 RepID=A0ABW0AN81_9ACTN
MPRPRADALRNRERIVAAAREMFVEFGSAVPLDEIARRAGIGNATLYRHFADRPTLIHEVVLSVVSRIADRADEAAAEEADPFDALRRFVHAASAERIGALCPVLSGAFDVGRPELDAGRARMERTVRELIERAQAAGRMRDDVAVGDVLVAIAQLTRPLPHTGCPDMGDFIHRHLEIFLDGLQAPARSQLTGRAATIEDLRAPMPH